MLCFVLSWSPILDSSASGGKNVIISFPFCKLKQMRCGRVKADRDVDDVALSPGSHDCSYWCRHPVVLRETKWTWSRSCVFHKPDLASDEPKTFATLLRGTAEVRHFAYSCQHQGNPATWTLHSPFGVLMHPQSWSQGAFKVLTETVCSSWSLKQGH